MYNTLQLFYAKNGSKKQLIVEKWEHFENGQKWPPSKGYRLCKIVTLGQNIKMHKNMFKTFPQHIAVLCKKRLQKQLIFEKWEHFENGQKWPPSKGYRLCKIVTLGQKLKMHKNMLKTFVQHIAVVLCKKRLQKTANIRKMRAFWKWAPSKGYNTVQKRHFGSKLKNAWKHAKNVSTTHCSCSMQKTAPKNS